MAGLTVDFYAGSFFLVFKESHWAKKQAELKEALSNLAGEISPLSIPHFYFFSNFSNAPLGAGGAVQKKIVKEGDLRFEVHLGEGLHTGLFLDQRENRRLVSSLSKGKRVLNLFSYTGAFTLAALRAGAREAVSVDLSKNYLEWLKRNLGLNDFPLSSAPTLARDVFRYLKEAKKKEERFDVIVLDPPTFSRNKSQTFSTEKDLESLVLQTAELLSKGGRLFVSLNTRKITPAQFRERVGEAVRPLKLKILQNGALPKDFRLAEDEKKNPHLKSCLVGL